MASQTGCGDLAAGAVGIDAGAEQDLGAVDVADAGDDVLAHQQEADRGAGGVDLGVGAGGVGVGAEGVFAEALHGERLFGGRDHGAGGRAAEVGDVGPGEQAEADEAARFRGEGDLPAGGDAKRAAAEAGEAGAGEAPHAVEAEMDAEPDIVGEAEEHLLAVGFGGFEHAAVEQGGAFGEAALRAAGCDGLGDEACRESARETVDGVTFGHAAPLWRRQARRGVQS